MFQSYDIGKSIKAYYCGAGRLVAAGTGDATAVTGATINRKPAGGIGFDSGKLVLPWHAVLTDTKTMALAIEYQESADGSSWDTAVPLLASTVVVTSSGGGAATGLYAINLDLSARKQYVRFNYTPDLNASGTDTAEVACVLVAGGSDVVPMVTANGSGG